MVKTEAVKRLRAFEPKLRAMGASALFLFGSTVREDNSPESDIDVFLDIEPESHFTLLDVVAAQRMLSTGLEKPVDLTTRDSLHPRLRDGIEAEAIRVF